MNLKHTLILPFLITFLFSLKGQIDYYQEYTFTEADPLRGMLRPERTCYDVTFYDLQIKIDIEEKYISGYNITLNITEYTHFSDVYKSKDGKSLALDYYVLPENLEKAKKPF